jgi:hypothetical protein
VHSMAGFGEPDFASVNVCFRPIPAFSSLSDFERLRTFAKSYAFARRFIAINMAWPRRQVFHTYFERLGAASGKTLMARGGRALTCLDGGYGT